MKTPIDRIVNILIILIDNEVEITKDYILNLKEGYNNEFKKEIQTLQAKHEEELKQLEAMVKDAINLPKGIEPHSFSDYKANHETK